MKPALTPEEWVNVTNPGVRRGERVVSVARHVGASGRTGFDVLLVENFTPHIVNGFFGGDRHALAALALHGQPFGFTREDVILCQDQIIRSGHTYGNNPKWVSLAARIEALLPPEAK